MILNLRLQNRWKQCHTRKNLAYTSHTIIQFCFNLRYFSVRFNFLISKKQPIWKKPLLLCYFVSHQLWMLVASSVTNLTYSINNLSVRNSVAAGENLAKPFSAIASLNPLWMLFRLIVSASRTQTFQETASLVPHSCSIQLRFGNGKSVETTSKTCFVYHQ